MVFKIVVLILLQIVVHTAGVRGHKQLRGVSAASCGAHVFDRGAFISTAAQGHSSQDRAFQSDSVDVSIAAHYSVADEACVLQILEAGEVQQTSQFFGADVSVRNQAPLDLEPLQTQFKPKIITVAGLPRTGSTSLGTIVQLWLVLADSKYEPSGHEPWMDSQHAQQHDYEVAKEQNISAWLKVHNMVGWVNDVADLVVLSHRDPVEELVSTTLSFNDWGYTPDKTCQLMLDGQKDLYTAAKDCCNGVAYDMQLENLVKNPKDVIRAVGTAIGVSAAVLTDDLLNYATQAYLASIPNSAEHGLPHQNQRWHAEAEKAKVRAQITQGIAKNPNCQNWTENKGAFMGFNPE